MRNDPQLAVERHVLLLSINAHLGIFVVVFIIFYIMSFSDAGLSTRKRTTGENVNHNRSVRLYKMSITIGLLDYTKCQSQ